MPKINLIDRLAKKREHLLGRVDCVAGSTTSISEIILSKELGRCPEKAPSERSPSAPHRVWLDGFGGHPASAIVGAASSSIWSVISSVGKYSSTTEKNSSGVETLAT